MTPDLITSEMVEKAAIGIFYHCRIPNRETWDELSPLVMGVYRSEAKAALEAVLPTLVEECAKAVEALDASVPHDVGSEEYARAIRSLSPPTTKEK